MFWRKCKIVLYCTAKPPAPFHSRWPSTDSSTLYESQYFSQFTKDRKIHLFYIPYAIKNNRRASKIPLALAAIQSRVFRVKSILYLTFKANNYIKQYRIGYNITDRVPICFQHYVIICNVVII